MAIVMIYSRVSLCQSFTNENGWIETSQRVQEKIKNDACGNAQEYDVYNLPDH